MRIKNAADRIHVPSGNVKISSNTEQKDCIIDKVEIKANNTANNPLIPSNSDTFTEKDNKPAMGEPVSGGSYTGNIRKHADFHSKILGNSRDVLVYLPPGYEEKKDKSYPVLYLADGQNKMNRETSFGGVEWGIDEAAEKLIKEGKMQDVIMVAVANTPDRMSEYTHVKDPKHGGGKLDEYARFLTEELKPFIDTTYRTSTRPEETGYLGSSLGGLSALYLGWNLPEVFGVVGALSPSIWWAGKDIVSRITNDSREKGAGKIWIDIGTQESGKDANNNGVDDAVEDARMAGETLLKKGYVFGKELYYYEAPGATHNEWHWAQRIDKVLMTLFPPKTEG